MARRPSGTPPRHPKIQAETLEVMWAALETASWAEGRPKVELINEAVAQRLGADKFTPEQRTELTAEFGIRWEPVAGPQNSGLAAGGSGS